MHQTLDDWPLGQPAQILHIDADLLSAAEVRRLAELGLIADAVVTPTQRGTLLARDPLALDVGRRRICIRGRLAAAIRVTAVEPAVGGLGS